MSSAWHENSDFMGSRFGCRCLCLLTTRVSGSIVRYRIDVLVDEQLILELKAVAETKGIHAAQLLTYMKLARIQTGLLINFNVEILKNGIQRFKL